MRVAFIGLSTPLFYDYRHLASKAPSDTVSSPNPILESPFGLMLLYDEIWFLCRSLCPQNMREAPQVRFLDERRMLPSMKDLATPDLWQQIEENSVLRERYRKARDAFFKTYSEALRRVGVTWSVAPDNHSHALQIGDFHTYANSVDLEKLLIDMEVVKRLNRPNLELITNSVSQSWLEDPQSPFLQAKLTEILTIENIPNYLTPQGPYDPCIEQARNDPFLKDFRKWIVSQQIPRDDLKLREVKRGVEYSIQKSEDEIFLKALRRRTRFMSIGKTMAGVAADVVVPGVSTVASLVEDIAGYFDDGKRRWQGFIVSMRNHNPTSKAAR